MADPYSLDTPNTNAYQSDFLAGKFASSPETTIGAIPGANPNSGPQNFTNPTLTPEQEAGFQTPSTAFISNKGWESGVDQEHQNALDATSGYYDRAARHHHSLAHAGRLADSADYLQESNELDPTHPDFITNHLNTFAKYPGAMGAAVNASVENQKQIYNQHQWATGQGLKSLTDALGKGHITQAEFNVAQTSRNYYDAAILAAQRSGTLAAQKEENAPEKRLESAYKALQAINAEGIKPDKDTEPEAYKAWRNRVQFLNEEIDAAQTSLKSARTKAAPAPANTAPSPEFRATEARFKTPGQIESLPRTASPGAPPAPMKSNVPSTDQYFSR